jgi:peptide/nickel transport system ATP-binding protein
VSYYLPTLEALGVGRCHAIFESQEKLGLVGESGSGKSTMALAMMRMIKPPGRIEAVR